MHKKCALKEMILEREKRVGGFCAVCNQEGTIYHVKDTPDYYESVVAGVLYKFLDGVQYNTRGVVRAQLKAEMERRRAVKAMDAHNERVPVWERMGAEVFAVDAEREVVESIPEPVYIGVIEGRGDGPVTVIVEAETVEELEELPEPEEVKITVAVVDDTDEVVAETEITTEVTVEDDTVNVTTDIEEQIAALQAQIAELEAEREDD